MEQTKLFQWLCVFSFNNQWLSPPHSLALLSANSGSKLRTAGSFCPQYSIDMFYELNLDGGLVFHKDKLTGIITEKDLLRGVATNKKVVGDIQGQVEKIVFEEEVITLIDSFDCHIYPVKNKQNIWTGYITKQQLLEAKKYQIDSEAITLNEIFEFAHNGIIAIDEKGYITAMNPAAEKLMNLKKEKAIGRFLTDVGIPSGLLDVVRTGKKVTDKYSVRKRKYISNRTPIFINGEVVGAVGIFQDISDIEKISNELNTVRQLLREFDSIMELSYDAILVLDKHGGITKSNNAFKRIMSLNEIPRYYQELIGKYIDNCVVSAVNKEKRRVTFIERNKRNDNLLFITATPVHLKNGVFEKIIVNIRDVSEVDKFKDSILNSDSERQFFSESSNNLKFVSHSEVMKKVKEKIEHVTTIDSIVFIQGEFGVGKEHIAQLIHANSSRKDGPFIKVNCEDIPESLMDSELFGYEEIDDFDNLERTNTSLVEKADGGIIFLEEISELTGEAQLKLVNFLKQNEIKKGNMSKKIDARIIATSSKNLKELVEKKKFRKDLYYLLNVVTISVPPLRERVEDIPLLVAIFQEKFSKLYNIEKFFSQEATNLLISYHWPGNVRELMNVVERLIITSPEPTVERSQVEDVIFQEQLTKSSSSIVSVNGIMPLKDAIEELEKQMITNAMKIYRNTRRSASALGVNQSTIVRKMQKYLKE